jgi:hypothetical protein
MPVGAEGGGAPGTGQRGEENQEKDRNVSQLLGLIMPKGPGGQQLPEEILFQARSSREK